MLKGSDIVRARCHLIECVNKPILNRRRCAHLSMLLTRCVKIVLLSVCLVVTAILLAIGLTVYFVYPRDPTIVDKGADVHTFNISTSSIQFNASFWILMRNPNYVDIKIQRISLDVLYENETLGTIVDTSTHIFPKRKTTRVTSDGKSLTVTPALETSLSTNTLEKAYNSYTATGGLKVTFSGPVQVSYLGFEINRDLKFSQTIRPPS